MKTSQGLTFANKKEQNRIRLVRLVLVPYFSKVLIALGPVIAQRSSRRMLQEAVSLSPRFCLCPDVFLLLFFSIPLSVAVFSVPIVLVRVPGPSHITVLRTEVLPTFFPCSILPLLMFQVIFLGTNRTAAVHHLCPWRPRQSLEEPAMQQSNYVTFQ